MRRVDSEKGVGGMRERNKKGGQWTDFDRFCIFAFETFWRTKDKRRTLLLDSYPINMRPPRAFHT
jgi:hypothetical protein